jgi:hypothetical protein
MSFYYEINTKENFQPLNTYERVALTENMQPIATDKPTTVKGKSAQARKSAKGKPTRKSYKAKKSKDVYCSKARKPKNTGMDDWLSKVDRTMLLKEFMDTICYFLLPFPFNNYHPQVAAYDSRETSESRVYGESCGAHFLLRLFGSTLFLVAVNLPSNWTVSNAQIKGYFLGKTRQENKERGRSHQLVPGFDELETPKFTQSCDFQKVSQDGLGWNFFLTTSIQHDGYENHKTKKKSTLPVMSQYPGWWAFEFQVEMDGFWETVAWHLVLCPTSIAVKAQVDAINSRNPGYTEILKQSVSQ